MSEERQQTVPRAGPTPVLITTKFHPPSDRPELVHRPRLLHLLTARRKLALVDAPAGWGKTTLLGEWRARQEDGRRFAWLSLDREDNDPVRFWAYVVAALARVAPELPTTKLGALQAPGTPVVDVMLPALINEVAELTSQIVLVLDDYHLISNSEIHDGISFLLDHLPLNLQLVIATRADPALPLARLRARGEMSEIRARELRFTEDETESLLNHVLGLGLEPRDVRRLHERTEGWAAGLYLAVLSLHGRPNVAELIADFAGDDRHVVEYLADEVLRNQPEDVRAFLLRTSILDRLCGSLCDEVTATKGSPQMLERIERSNLFLTPLDTTRGWYRYHRLFGGLLRHELQQREPELVPELHRRAARWHKNHGSIPEAIQHAIAAGDVGDARELIARNWNDFFNQGRLATVAAWLDALPQEAVLADPRLCVARAWILLDYGRLDEVNGWIDAVEQAAAEDGSHRRAATILRLVHQFKVGDIDRAHESARRALELHAGTERFEHTVASCLLGVTSYWLGHADAAVGALEDASRLADDAGNKLGSIYALGYLAVVNSELGNRGEAERCAAAASLLADDAGRAEHFVSMLAHVGRGKVLAERGELAEAERAFSRATELSQRGAGLVEIGAALFWHAEAKENLGDRAGAQEQLRTARRTLERCPGPGILREMITGLEKRLQTGPRPAAPTPAAVEALTDRELAVLRLLPAQLSQRDIGRELYVSLNTVKTHTKSIFRKLGVSSRSEAVLRARELGLL